MAKPRVYMKLEADKSNIEEVILSYLPMIKNIIQKIEIPETEDLIQVGLLSVLESLNKGYKDSNIIRTEIIYYLYKYLLTTFTFSRFEHRRISLEKLRVIMNNISILDKPDIDFYLNNDHLKEYMLIEMESYTGVNGVSSNNTEEEALKNYEIERMINLLECLNPIEKEIIILYYGLFNQGTHTIRDLASRYNVSKAMIEKHKHKAEVRLRHYMSLSESSAKRVLSNK